MDFVYFKKLLIRKYNYIHALNSIAPGKLM